MSSDQPDQEDSNVEPARCGSRACPPRGPSTPRTTHPWPQRRGPGHDRGAAPGHRLAHRARGPNTGARFLLDDLEVSAGRHPDSDIFLDDVTVSRKHALFIGSGGYPVRDAGSLNGTYVNRERIEEAHLHTGDEVQIGKFGLSTTRPDAAPR